MKHSLYSYDFILILSSLFLCFIVYKLVKFYWKVLGLPPGPLPIPFFGNILMFVSKNGRNNVLDVINKKYGPVFTLWLGNSPFVFITDVDTAREAFLKNEFTGRHKSYYGSLISNERYQDIVFSDCGPIWEALRKVGHLAVQKYSFNDKLVHSICDSVDEIIGIIIDKEGLNKEFSTNDYSYLLFLNIIANSAFGKKYSFEDEEFQVFKHVMRDLPKQIGKRYLFWEMSPIIRFLDQKIVRKHRQAMTHFIEKINREFKSHFQDYNELIERDFCDSLISAKNEALREGKVSAIYLSDENLAMVIFDLLFAGTDTSQQTFQWLLILLTHYPNIQKRLRFEIQDQIGDRFATQEDSNHCHYVMAFISETLRFKSYASMGFPHKAVASNKIGNFIIPKGTGLIVHQGIIMTNEKYWTHPKEFKPERFLQNGKYVRSRPKAFIPFGVGRRLCLGEKLALTDLFLVLVRFLQSTAGYEIVGQTDSLEAIPHIRDSVSPRDYKIQIKLNENL